MIDSLLDTPTAPSRLFGFPNPVNEKAARVVAGGVMIMGLAAMITGWHWIVVIMAVGFAARVVAGPRFSVLGQLATKVIAPRLGAAKLVPGPPKRFAQAIGLTLTAVAAGLSLVLGLHTVGTVLLGVLVLFAALESVLGFCAGCWLFGRLMAWGLIPAETCEACNNIWARP